MIFTPDRAKLFFYLIISSHVDCKLTITYTKKNESKLIVVNRQINFQLDNWNLSLHTIPFIRLYYK